MDKTAKEMFEELGYELIQDDDYLLIYVIGKGKWFQLEIYFSKFNKQVNLDTQELVYGHSFGMQELKAINKQVEELGWNK